MKQSIPGRRQTRVGRMLTALPIASKLCSTCAFWGGAREISCRGFIEIHPYSKGECRGENFKHLEMAALATCKCWKTWHAFDGEKDGQQRQGSG